MKNCEEWNQKFAFSFESGLYFSAPAKCPHNNLISPATTRTEVLTLLPNHPSLEQPDTAQ
jgi:hypothetical protein